MVLFLFLSVFFVIVSLCIYISTDYSRKIDYYNLRKMDYNGILVIVTDIKGLFNKKALIVPYSTAAYKVVKLSDLKPLKAKTYDFDHYRQLKLGGDQ